MPCTNAIQTMPPTSAACKVRRLARGSDEEAATDHISRLPDPILVHIISFIPIRKAVQLSLVCERWNRLWTQTPCLNFKPDVRSSMNMAAFVDRCLLLHERSNISTFRLADYDCVASNQQLDSWLLLAVWRGVETLSLLLSFHQTAPYSLPACFYGCHTLRSLKLKNCRLNIPPPGRSFALPALTAIKLRSMDVDSDELRTLISSCPSLQNLSLVECNKERHLRVLAGNSRLEKLEITDKDCCSRGLGLEIFAPSATSPSIDVPEVTRDYHVVDLSSLRTVSVSSAFVHAFDQSTRSAQCAGFLQQIGHARELHLDSYFVQMASRRIHATGRSSSSDREDMLLGAMEAIQTRMHPMAVTIPTLQPNVFIFEIKSVMVPAIDRPC